HGPYHQYGCRTVLTPHCESVRNLDDAMSPKRLEGAPLYRSRTYCWTAPRLLERRRTKPACLRPSAIPCASSSRPSRSNPVQRATSDARLLLRLVVSPTSCSS